MAGKSARQPVATTPSIMHMQPHRAQVRKANFADEIANGISH
jgi:hypothetical protein